MFVKICGITSPDDAAAAADAGADAIGLNFVEGSTRCIDLDTARTIRSVAPDHLITVGVFRDQRADEVLATVAELHLDAAQLHGHGLADRSAVVAAGVDVVIAALPAEDVSVDSIGELTADIVMLDAATPGGGVPFDWDLVGDLVDRRRILLAGGLGPGNVGEAIRRVRPWGVDVASGVEVEPGRKDPDAVVDFVARARRAARTSRT